MTTVLAVYGPRGCVGVCDARCHNAMQPMQLKEPRRNACICICGGANHGLGELHAIYNTTKRRIGRSREAVEAFAKERGLNPAELVVMDRVNVRSKHKAARVAKILVKGALLERPSDPFVCEQVT
jgi:hypothetical protein